MSEPLFSVVIPVYRVRAFLRECLDSVLEQSFGDFELIAVDDCSPDGCDAVLADYAEADKRVQVIRLATNSGLAAARNAGVDAASGRYLLFVDGDDTLTPGALAAIAGRLEATGWPEVLVFDYERGFPTGERVRDGRAHLLREDGPATFTIGQRPRLLDLLMVAWNKAYRRDFVTASRLRFPPGYYEDTPWTFQALLSARSIAVLDRVCLTYRQRRTGSILRDTSRRHFDLFAQYDRVFAFLDAHPEHREWRGYFADRMLRHALNIWAQDRVPRPARAEFFQTMADYHRRYRPADHPWPGGGDGLKLRLAGHGAYRSFLVSRAAQRGGRRAVGALRRGRRLARRPLGSARRLARRAVRAAYYRYQLRRPVDDHLAVYAAYWYRGYACNPRAIYEKARELAPSVRGVWIVRGDAASRMPPGVDYAVAGSPAALKALARAKYLINNVNFPDLVVKRPGTVHVQTHHGTPLKTMGLDLRDYPIAAAKMDFAKLLRRCDRWDVSISSNRFTSEIWERVYPCRYETLESGYPRNDRLVDPTREEIDRIRAELGIAPGQRAVLYAPTHRDYQATFVPPLDLAGLARALGPDHVLLVRAHYFDIGRAPGERPGTADVRDVSWHPCVEELCLAADVLITDYSSIMFDYAVLDRPIVIYADDWDTYRRTRGTYFDLMAFPPGVVATTEQGLAEAFTSGEYAGEEAGQARAAFRRRFCHLDDGHAAERVVRHVFGAAVTG